MSSDKWQVMDNKYHLPSHEDEVGVLQAIVAELVCIKRLWELVEWTELTLLHQTHTCTLMRFTQLHTVWSVLLEVYMTTTYQAVDNYIEKFPLSHTECHIFLQRLQMHSSTAIVKAVCLYGIYPHITTAILSKNCWYPEIHQLQLCFHLHFWSTADISLCQGSTET